MIVTGSKQGITTPPGNAPYNVSKAGVKAVTEALAHELRSREGCRTSAHLLIPGFVYTGLAKAGRRREAGRRLDAGGDDHLHAGAHGAGRLLHPLPDNETTREQDEKRMAWAMGDIIANRPALSRWHPDHADAFERHMEG